MSTSETAEILSLTETNVKVRLHRAHELLRAELFARAGANSTQAFVSKQPGVIALSVPSLKDWNRQLLRLTCRGNLRTSESS